MAMASVASASAVWGSSVALSVVRPELSASTFALCVSFSGGESLRRTSKLGSRLHKERGERRRNRFSASRSQGSANVFCAAAVQKLGDSEAVGITPDSSKGFPAAAGVYAIFNKEGNLEYIGISRRISASIQTHFQELPELCASAKVCVIDAQEKSALTDAWRIWLQEYVDTSGKVPPGNVQGNTTWTARKQRAARPEIKLTPGPNVQLNIPLVELIDKVVKSCQVVAFVKGTRTAPQCGFSHRVLTILNEAGVDYEVVNVLDDHHNPGLREAIKVYSQWPTIPQVYVKGEFVGGADILDQMVQTGEIKILLQKS